MADLDPSDRIALVAAATVVNELTGGRASIAQTVIDIALMADIESPQMKRLHQVLTAQRFSATLERVELEPSSTRAKLHLLMGGKPEVIRTERTDHPDGMSVYNLAKQLRGHRVLVYKDLQPMAGGNQKVRVCVHLGDLGPAASSAKPGPVTRLAHHGSNGRNSAAR